MYFSTGANPSQKNDSGHKPVDYARDPTVQKLLRQHEEKYEQLRREKEAEERRKFPLELRIKEVIVGQEGPITTVASGRFETVILCYLYTHMLWCLNA